MLGLPCSFFFPITFEGMQFCSNCGFLSDFHQPEPIGVIQVSENNQLYPHQHQQPGGLAVFPPSWQNPQMVQWMDYPPAPLDSGNVVTNSCNTLSNQLLPDENVKHRIFSPHQVRCMLDKARTIQWTLKGLSQDAGIDQFCKEIGVARAQFGKWVYRTRRRFGWRRRRR